MSQLPDTTVRNLPTPIRQDLDAHVRRLGNALFGGQPFTQSEAPTPALRRDLFNRHADLQTWLTPTGKDHARPMIAAVLQVMPSQGGKGSAEDAAKTQALYLHALADLPRHAVKAACEAALRGEIGDPHWAPTPGDLRVYAERHCETLVRERRAISAILAAPVSDAVVNPDRKKKMLEEARKFVAGARMAGEGQRRGRMTGQEIADAQAIATALRTGRDPRPMPKLSPYLRASMGLPDFVPADDMPDDRFDAEDAA